jgi:hypothetical protein
MTLDAYFGLMSLLGQIFLYKLEVDTEVQPPVEPVASSLHQDVPKNPSMASHSPSIEYSGIQTELTPSTANSSCLVLKINIFQCEKTTSLASSINGNTQR